MNEKIDVMAVLARKMKAFPTDRNIRLCRDAVAELIETAVKVHAACRAGIEPDLIALADALDSVGAKDVRKAALARIGTA